MRSHAATTFVRIAAAGMVFAGFQTTVASGQSAAAFYQGKTLDMQIGYSVGGGYDLYARLMARHLGRHIPGNPNRNGAL